MIFSPHYVLTIEKSSANFEEIFDQYNGGIQVGCKATRLGTAPIWAETLHEDVATWCRDNMAAGYYTLPSSQDSDYVDIVFQLEVDYVKFKIFWC